MGSAVQTEQRGSFPDADEAMNDPKSVKRRIHEAFAAVEYPGDWCLRGSNEGEEPYLLEKEFKGQDDWRTLEPGFLDQAPDGYGSALSFFSDEAFHFYLPAYLIADIDCLLDRHDPLYHLTQGLTDGSRNERVNSRRYGERTWFDVACYKFAMFNQQEAGAIVAYLRLKRGLDESERGTIDQALRSFWLERAGEGMG